MSGQHIFGEFAWYSLATTDPDRAVAFYLQIFPWKHTVMNLPNFGEYPTLQVQDEEFGTVKELDKCEGTLSSWVPYIKVDDVEQACQRAERMGGTICTPEFLLPGMGQMALIKDPWGGLSHPFASIAGAEADSILRSEEGFICWSDLMTPRSEESGAFYGELYGWKIHEENYGYAGPYRTLHCQGEMIGGIMQEAPEMGLDRAVWLPHISVKNVDALAARIPELGGKIVAQPKTIPNVGRYCRAQDPTGAFFAIFSKQ